MFAAEQSIWGILLPAVIKNVKHTEWRKYEDYI